MIALDLNIYLLTNYFGISLSKLREYGNKSIDEIMELEAEAGNVKAANFDRDILQDPIKMIEFFELDNPENKYLIMSNFNTTDLRNLLPYLEKKDLTIGLNFFNDEKLISLIQHLPQKQLAKILLEKFSPEEFLKKTDERELDKFFDSTKVEKQHMMKFLEKISPDQLSKMIESITGNPIEGKSKEDMISEISNFNSDTFKSAIKVMDPENKILMINNLTQENPKLFLEFSQDALSKPIIQLQKEDMIKTVSHLEQEDLIKLVQELPDELLAIVTTQINTEEFAKILYRNFKDILSEIGIGSQLNT